MDQWMRNNFNCSKIYIHIHGSYDTTRWLQSCDCPPYHPILHCIWLGPNQAPHWHHPIAKFIAAYHTSMIDLSLKLASGWLRGCLHHGPRSCYMSGEYFHGHIFMVWIFAKCISSCLWLLTERIEHAPKSGCVYFFGICPKRGALGFLFPCWTFSPSFLLATCLAKK